MTRHTVVYGSCLDFLKYHDLPDGLQLAVTSPPYYNARDYSVYSSYQAYLLFIKKVSRSIYERLDEGGHYCLNLTAVTETKGERKLYPTSTDALEICQKIGFELVWDVAWLKPRGLPPNGDYNYKHPYPFKMYLDSRREEIWVLRKGGPRRVPQETLEESAIPESKVREYSSREWEIDPVLPAEVGHPASYPLELPKRCIEMFSVRGDTVFDPFLGSGTTMEAAIETGRNSYGTEQQKKYLPVIYRRVGAGQPRISGGPDFEFENITVSEILEQERKNEGDERRERDDRRRKAAEREREESGTMDITSFTRK
jgi:DNA modification methylase